MNKKIASDERSRRIVGEITQICGWLESEEGFHAHLQEGKKDYLGQVFGSKLAQLRGLIISLIDVYHDCFFIIDLRYYRMPIDAYCSFVDVIRQIEEERKVPEDALLSRFIWVHADIQSDLEIQALNALYEKDVQKTIVTLRKEATSFNSLAPAIDALLA